MNKNKYSLEQQKNKWITGATLPTTRALFEYLKEYENTEDKTLDVYSRIIVSNRLTKLGLEVKSSEKLKLLEIEKMILQHGSISKVAFDIGMYRETLSNILYGATRPTLNNSSKIANYLGVDTEDIFFSIFLNALKREQDLSIVKKRLSKEVGGIQ